MEDPKWLRKYKEYLNTLSNVALFEEAFSEASMVGSDFSNDRDCKRATASEEELRNRLIEVGWL